MEGNFIFKPQDAQWKSLSEELNEQISSQLCHLSQSNACLYLDGTSLNLTGRNFRCSEDKRGGMVWDTGQNMVSQLSPLCVSDGGKLWELSTTRH